MTERKTFLRGILGTGGLGGCPRRRSGSAVPEYYTVLPQLKDLAFWWRTRPQEDFGGSHRTAGIWKVTVLLSLLFTVDSICYEIRRETGCVPEEEKLVAYQKKRNWLHTRRRYWLRTRRRKTGCVPEEEKLVAYQKKGNWLHTRKRETGCVPGEEKLVAYQE